mmetsp:Transcript_32045/g.51590  ORF Transcript_32045/g.51590 Transcript_32045/m.51590 type:complete len:175 (-) Transcript_32045:1377-1901(-)
MSVVGRCLRTNFRTRFNVQGFSDPLAYTPFPAEGEGEGEGDGENELKRGGKDGDEDKDEDNGKDKDEGKEEDEGKDERTSELKGREEAVKKDPGVSEGKEFASDPLSGAQLSRIEVEPTSETMSTSARAHSAPCQAQFNRRAEGNRQVVVRDHREPFRRRKARPRSGQDGGDLR